MSEFRLPPPDIELTHAQEAAIPVLCPGCQEEIKDGDQIRSMFISLWGIIILVHNTKKCIFQAGMRMPRRQIRLELLAQAFWLCSEQQREKAHLS